MESALSLPDDLVTDAVQAYDRYRFAFDNGLLIQNGWHQEQDGRHLACALGVLGKAVDSSADCPAQVMPKWLARMVPYFFDRLAFDDARAWGLAKTRAGARAAVRALYALAGHGAAGRDRSAGR